MVARFDRGGDAAPAFSLTRRTAMLASAAILNSGVAHLATNHDRAVLCCLQWVSWQAEINTLQLEWARLEHKLSIRYADFFHLPEAKRGELPDGGSRMAQIDARIDELYEARNRQLPYLPTLKATSVEIVLAKLAVAQELVYEDEFPEAHRIIRDSIADLTRLWPGPGRTRTRQIA